MTTKQKTISKELDKNIAILKEIVEIDKDLKTIKESENRMRERRAMLLQEAVDRKIERAGNCKLMQKSRVSRTVDMAAIESMLAPDDFKKIAHVTLKDAGKFLSTESINKCTSKTISLYWMVAEMYEPAGCSKKSVVI
jgi:hypothetical protein